MPRVRVLYSFPHTFGAPGIGTTAFQVVCGLVGQDLKVDLVTTSLARAVPDVQVRTTLSVAGQRIPHRVLGLANAYRWHDVATSVYLDRHAREFDVVHVWPRAVSRTAATARTHGLPVVRESPSPHSAVAYRTAADATRGLGLELPRHHFHAGSARRLREELDEYERATHNLVASDYALQSFIDQGVPENRMLSYRYGANLDEFHPLPRQPRAGGGIVGVFVGRVEPAKGVHIAVEAWRAAALPRGSRLLLVGERMAGYLEDTRSLNDAGVEQLGFRTDVRELIATSDVLVMPSLSEGSALVTYEALASGTPSLVSDASGSIIRHGETGLIHRAGDIHELTTHLRRLIDEPHLLKCLQEGATLGREAASWSCSSRELAQVYARIAS